jgi:hypothetical protein
VIGTHILKKHYESDSIFRSYGMDGKEGKTLESSILFNCLLKKLGSDERIHGGAVDPWEILEMAPVNLHHCDPSYLL